MVYPGEALLNVELQSQLDSDSIVCSVETDTSCTATITREIYTVTVNQSNDIDSTINTDTFDGRALFDIVSVDFIFPHSKDIGCNWRDVEFRC